jgi:pilus assembly protein Flp/PilA
MLFALSEKGQGLVEYAIIIAFVALVVIAIMRLMGPRVGNVFSSVNNSF